MRAEQQRVKQLLTEAITLLCRNSLAFKEDVTVEGLLGITLDKTDIFLVSINETIQSAFAAAQPAAVRDSQKRDCTAGDDSPTRKKRRRRRSSSDELSQSPPSSPVSKQPEQKESALARVNIKHEKSVDSDNTCDRTDGRLQNPAHDETQEPPHSNNTSKPHGSSQTSSSKISNTLSPSNPESNSRHSWAGDSGISHSSTPRVKAEIKAEPEEEEDCFLIEDDDDARSDSSQHSQSRANEMMMMSQSWSGPGGGDDQGFNMSELDMVSADSFQQQFGNLSQLAQQGGSGSSSSLMPFTGVGAGGAMGGPGDEPGTSQDSQRAEYPCSICGRVFKWPGDVTRHVRTVHLKQRFYYCDVCGKSYGRADHLKTHKYTQHSQQHSDNAKSATETKLGYNYLLDHIGPNN